MTHFRLYILFLFFSCSVFAQEEASFLEFRSAESELKLLFDHLYEDENPNADSCLLLAREKMGEVLALPGAMDYPWSRLNRIGVVDSEDGKLRVFSWHHEENQESFRYYAFLQLRKKRGAHELIELIDNGLSQAGVYRADQRTDYWYGKLYYGVVSRQERRKVYYTLLGLDFNNSRSNIKSVEVFSIKGNKNRFEKDLFSNGNQIADRVVLEYSDQVSITVRYDPMLAMIVFDHLAPLHPVYKNNLEFYGPDGSFDGLEFSEGMWIFLEDIDARMQY